MKEDIACDVIGNVKVCVDRNSKNPFAQSKEIYTIVRENNKDYDLKYSSKCSSQGIHCFSTSLQSLLVYFSLYLIAAVLINFMHESFHFAILYFSGENVDGFQFGFSSGSTSFESLPQINSHNVAWWYFLTMGSLLCVNFVSIILVYVFYKPKTHRQLFISENIYTNRYFEVFIHAIAYLSAISILTNTILSSLSQFLSFQDVFSVKSDFMWAWEISLDMSTEIYSFSEYYIWILIILAGAFSVVILKSNYRVQNISITIVILICTSIVFFFNGISNRNLFQWMVISSVTLEIVFSMIYIFKFGKKIE